MAVHLVYTILYIAGSTYVELFFTISGRIVLYTKGRYIEIQYYNNHIHQLICDQIQAPLYNKLF